MVARETAAIKVSGLFPICQPGATKSERDRGHGPLSPRRRLSSRYRRGYRRRWSVSIYTYIYHIYIETRCMLHLFALFASNHGIGHFPRRADTLCVALRPQKYHVPRFLLFLRSMAVRSLRSKRVNTSWNFNSNLGEIFRDILRV